MRMRLFSLFLLLCGCSSFTAEPGTVLRGKLYWQGEVRLRGDLILESGAELTIAPGTQILFERPAEGEDPYREHPYFPGSELIVRGRLLALGTPDQPIVFRAANPADAPGSWGGVNIEEAPEVRFVHCQFLQANSAVHARQTTLSIERSTFRNNLVGVRFHDTRLLLEQNLFEKNGTAIRFHFGAPVIRQNLIRNNQKGIFISAEPRDYLIEQNDFVDNRPYQISLGEGVRADVDLRDNYWSDSPGGELEGYFFDGRVDDWLGRILYRPSRKQPASRGPRL